MSALVFQLTIAAGRTETLVVEGERALLGAAAHCDVRLPAEHTAPEHVEIVAASDGLAARVRAREPAVAVDGRPLADGPIALGSLLAFGPVQVRVSLVEAALPTATTARRDKERTNPLVYLLAIVAVPASLYVILDEEPEDVVTAMPKDVPALFGPPVAACPQPDPEQAASLARDKRVLAEARRERRPFHVQDGVAAVPLFEAASACFGVAHADEDARDARAAGETLRRQVDDDYRTHRVRLEHAIAVSDWPLAHKEVRVLRALLEGKQGPYVTWLSNLDRKLQLRYGRKS